MSREELELALQEVQNNMDENTFLIVEKGCVEVYSAEEYLATPMLKGE